MTRERATELAPILEAYGRGETVQVHRSGEVWMDLQDPEFTTGFTIYRIKPKPLEVWVVLITRHDLPNEAFSKREDAVSHAQGHFVEGGYRIVKMREVEP